MIVISLIFKYYLCLSNFFLDDPNLRSLNTPQIDYDQWKPLGRGDPLKNDPTYDYVPPVLDRVQYWVDPALRKPDASVPGENHKTEILLLGITSKKPAAGASQADSRRDTYDPYLKYVPGSNFHPNSNQRIARPSFIPSIPTSFFPSFFPSNKNKYADRTTFSKGTEQRVPYTMLMPPPPVDPNASPNNLPETPSPLVTQKSTQQIVFTTSSPVVSSTIPSSGTTSSVTVQPASLVYQSSSLSDASEFNTNNRQASDPSTVSWLPPTTTKGAIPNYREELVYNTHLAPPESYIEIEFSPNNFTNKPLIAADSNQNINYVTPPPSINTQYKEIMFKGQVSDDNIDISNTYVKIGKPEAEVHSTGFGMSSIPIKSIVQHPVPSSVVMFPHSINSNDQPKQKIPPLTMQTLQDMQTMHPPPVTQNPVFTKNTNPVINILEKEKSRPVIFKDLTTSYLGSSTSTINSFVTLPTTSVEQTATTTDPPTTTMTSLTTDPLFKHYKQPSEPLKGPLYMIIQGHSKVKTYGPSKQIHGILIQESNEITDDKYEESKYEVRHLHGFQRGGKVEEQPRTARAGDIQTLKHVVQTGLGSIDISDNAEVQRRSSQDFQEAELQLGYEVADETATTERYHKGIVEEARKLKV